MVRKKKVSGQITESLDVWLTKNVNTQKDESIAHMLKNWFERTYLTHRLMGSLAQNVLSTERKYTRE